MSDRRQPVHCVIYLRVGRPPTGELIDDVRRTATRKAAEQGRVLVEPPSRFQPAPPGEFTTLDDNFTPWVCEWDTRPVIA